MSAFSRFLARWRVVMFVLTLCLVVGGAFLVPHLNVNTDMTSYLPDDYPMKQGLDIIREQVPDMEEQIHNLGSTFGNGMDLMPTNLPQTLAIGVALLFVVLLIMCSSVAEVLLFLLTALCAVALNMGTNALRPSVSMVTNTLAPVLQMVLSMDYCIILMNRYRQERTAGCEPLPAMSRSIASSVPAVLSSAFTTISSLLMLSFIKIKIGPDFGFVLAKGVAFSLLCNFTVLPALMVWADKQVIYKVKKTPRFPAGAMARFQMKFRIPITLFFVVLTVAAAILQSRTRISFAPDWHSKASEHMRADNPLMLLYSTADEAAIPELMQLLERDTNVLQTISYPTTLGCKRTAAQMRQVMSGFAQDTLPEELLQMVYYARSHPDLDGRLSFAEIEDAVQSLSQAGLLPSEFNFDNMVADLMEQMRLENMPDETDTVAAADTVLEALPPAVDDTTPPAEAAPVAEVTSTLESQPESEPQPVAEATPPAEPQPAEETPAETPAEPQPVVADTLLPQFTYEDVTRQLTAAQVAQLAGVEAWQANMLFRMAGKAGATMSLAELCAFVQDHILTNRRYASMVPKEFAAASEQLEQILAAGPTAKPAVGEAFTAEPDAETAPAADTQALALAPAADTPEPAPVPAQISVPETVQAPAPVPVVAKEPSPLEKLIDMMLSGWRYSASRVHSALSAAGVPVSRVDIDMLYLYALSRRDFDPAQTMTPQELVYYVSDTLLQMPSLQRMVPDQTRHAVDSARAVIASSVDMLRTPNYSFAIVSTSYPPESDVTFGFVEQARASADSLLAGQHYWIGESEMYKELKDAFPSELLLLSILTILAIYLIVAFTFRSVLLPLPLVLSVLTGVYVNVIVSGIGGHTMYFLAYLIIQGILMGAAIDYSILYTSYYRAARKSVGKAEAIRAAYEGTSHSVLTSGLILIIVPMVMSFTMQDPMIAGILKSLSIGALAAVVIILFLLPAVVAVLDRKK